MKPCIWKLVGVAALGAVGGFLFMFTAMFVFGLQPSSSGERNGIGALFTWLNAPLASSVNWLAKQKIIAADNIFIGILLCLGYWLLFGAAGALGLYYLGTVINGQIHAIIIKKDGEPPAPVGPAHGP